METKIKKTETKTYKDVRLLIVFFWIKWFYIIILVLLGKII